MKGTTYGWMTWAAVNAAAGGWMSAEYQTVHAAGLSPLAAGLVTLAADTRSLMDLDAVYGPYAAVLGPVLTTAAGQLGGGHSAVPALVSVAAAVLARSSATRKGSV